jgi:hypothetical protein
MIIKFFSEAVSAPASRRVKAMELLEVMGGWRWLFLPGWVLLIMAAIALIYFAGADLLHLARLGAYASLAEDDAHPVPAPEAATPPDLDPAPEAAQPIDAASAVDTA